MYPKRFSKRLLMSLNVQDDKLREIEYLISECFIFS